MESELAAPRKIGDVSGDQNRAVFDLMKCQKASYAPVLGRTVADNFDNCLRSTFGKLAQCFQTLFDLAAEHMPLNVAANFSDRLIDR